MPSKVYLLIYARMFGISDQVMKALDAVPEIIDWRADFPNSAYIVSDLNPRQLVEAIRAKMSVPEPMIAFQVSVGSSDGWAPMGTWDYLRDAELGSLPRQLQRSNVTDPSAPDRSGASDPQP